MFLWGSCRWHSCFEDGNLGLLYYWNLKWYVLSLSSSCKWISHVNKQSVKCWCWPIAKSLQGAKVMCYKCKTFGALRTRMFIQYRPFIVPRCDSYSTVFGTLVLPGALVVFERQKLFAADYFMWPQIALFWLVAISDHSVFQRYLSAVYEFCRGAISYSCQVWTHELCPV